MRWFRRHGQLNLALSDQAILSGSNFLIGILLARYLGAEGYGHFVLAWMIVLFANSIQISLITHPMMTIGPKQSRLDLPGYYGAVLAQQLVFSIAVFLLLLIGINVTAPFYPEWRLAEISLPLACALLAFQGQEHLRRQYFSRSRPYSALATDAVAYFGQLLLIVALFRYGSLSTGGVLWAIASAYAIGIVIALIHLDRVVLDFSQIRTTATRHWKFSKWLMASTMLSWFTGNIFIITAGAMIGAAAVGGMRAAYTLIGVAHILFMGLENIVPVRAAEYYSQHGTSALVAYLRKVALYGATGTIVIGTVAAAAPHLWITIVFGDAYAEYSFLLRWYAVIVLVHFLSLPLLAGLRAIESTRPVFLTKVIVTVVSLILVYPLVKLLDVTGVVVGQLTAACTYFGVLLFFFRTAVR